MKIKQQLYFNFFKLNEKYKTIGLMACLLLLVFSSSVLSKQEIPIIETVIFSNGFQLPSVPQPVILNSDELGYVPGDDYNAIIAWNSYSWINHDDPAFDQEKQLGIYGYKIEWGPLSEGFINSAITVNRSYQLQPLVPGIIYIARVYAISAYGELSLPSMTIKTAHDANRVNGMRERLNGFFDDFNASAGGFDELKWNQAYSGCVAQGTGGQHINAQFHGHNLLATGGCDRGVAVSRARKIFDITNRTGHIEFDLDGAKGSRQFWYLDFNPVDQPWGHKRDLSGHVSLGESGNAADPMGLLRIVQSGHTVGLQMADETGVLFTLDDQYQNGACGNDLRFCSNAQGGYNLLPQTNVRHHWRIAISQTHISIFIEDILVVDASLAQLNWPQGLPWARMQVAWTYFSYNTAKENIVRGLLHWDNFGFDAPQADDSPEVVVHNYSDGNIGPQNYVTNNCCAPRAQLNKPLSIQVPIVDAVVDTDGNLPLKAELMFTLQGGYEWSQADHVFVNGQHYDMPQPQATVVNMDQENLIGSIIPYSASLNIDPSIIITGSNLLSFHLNNIAIFNVHIELTFAQKNAPIFTQPIDIFGSEEYLPKIMPNPGPVGVGILIDKIAGVPAYQYESLPDRSYRLNESISGVVAFDVRGNSKAQMLASGNLTGITHYQIWQDGVPGVIVPVNMHTPSPAFLHLDNLWDTTGLCNGEHSLFVKAFTPEGTASFFDYFLAHSEMGEYRPIRVTTVNADSSSCE